MPTLPEGTKYGTLTWQVIRAVGDTAQDPDRDPDATVIAGLTAVFTPTVSVMKDATVPVTIFANPITATFDAQGHMVGEDGQRGIRLIATDSPNLQPQGVQYKVVLSAPTISSQTLTVEVWADQTTDLTTAVVPSAGSRTRLATVIPTADDALLPPSTLEGDLVLAQDTSQLYRLTDAALVPIANLRGEKGDTGDITPQATQALADAVQARDDARGAAGDAQGSAGEASEAEELASQHARDAQNALGQVPALATTAGSQAAVQTLAANPEVVSAAAAMAQSDAGLIRRTLSAEPSGGFLDEDGHETDLIVDGSGNIPDHVLLGRWTTRQSDAGLIPEMARGFTEIAGGFLDEDGHATELVVTDRGLVPDDVLDRWAQRMGGDQDPSEDPTAGWGLGRGLMTSGPTGAAIPVVSDASRLACWGDSLTSGWPTSDFGTTQPSDLSWPGVLAGDWAGSVYNGGVSGQSADEIALRQGGYVLTVDAVSIPASGAVAVTTQQVFGWRLDRAWSCPGTLAGVDGALSRSGSMLTFTRSQSGDAVDVPSGEPFVSTPGVEHAGDVHVVFAGRNDIGYVSPAGDIVERSVAATVAMMDRTGVAHRRALLVGTTTATGETAGSTGYQTVTAINAELERLYPWAFFDLRHYLVTQAIYDLGITPTTTDLAKIAGDTLPPSIMASSGTDTVHYSVATAALVATQIKTQLAQKGWII